MNMWCLIPLGIVLAISLLAGIFAKKKKEDDFFLANRSISWPMLVGTFIGLHVGGGVILGGADAVLRDGLIGCVYGLSLALGMIFLGLGFAGKIRTMNAETLPDLLTRRFNSPLLKKVSGVIAVMCLSGILIAQSVGLKEFFVSLGFSHPGFFIFAWVLVVIYTSFGGLLAVVWTDTIQAILMVGMLGITFCFTILPHTEELHRAIVQEPIHWENLSLPALLFPLCYIFTTQDVAQRCFSAKSSKDIAIACHVTAGLLLLIIAIPTCCGLLGKTCNIHSENGAIFMQVVQLFSNPFVFIMAASAILLAIVSTASAILLALGSNVAQDLFSGKTNGRLVTTFIGAIATFGPWFGGDIISWIVTCNELAVSTVFIPIIVAVFAKRQILHKQAAWGSIICGILGTMISHSFSCQTQLELFPLGASAIGFVIGHFIGKNSKKCDEAIVLSVS